GPASRSTNGASGSLTSSTMAATPPRHAVISAISLRASGLVPIISILSAEGMRRMRTDDTTAARNRIIAVMITGFGGMGCDYLTDGWRRDQKRRHQPPWRLA